MTRQTSDIEPLGEPTREDYEIEIEEIGFERPNFAQYCKSHWKHLIIVVFFLTIALFLLATVLALGIKFVEHNDNSAVITKRNDGPVANTSAGPVRGVMELDIFVFKGIQYGVTPEDDSHRWSEPTFVEYEYDYWDEPEDVVDFAPPCLQRSINGTLIGNGNCLCLNIWTPSLNASSELNVMVFVHGGGLISGSGNDPDTSPSASLARALNMVFVSLNYRLNVFGFLTLNVISSYMEPSGNYGLEDQILALQWVQKNIHAFGGSAQKVTIFGQGSGATSIHALLGSKKAQGLFHRAWLMSPSPKIDALLEDSEISNLDFFNNTECAVLPNDQAYDCLCKLSPTATMNAVPWNKWANKHFGAIPSPNEKSHQLIVIDGNLLRQSPVESWEEEVYTDVPLLIGNVEAETYDLMSKVPSNWVEYDNLVVESLKKFDATGNLSQQILALYSHQETPRFQLASLTSDLRALCPMNDVIKVASATFKSPVFRYVIKAAKSGTDLAAFFNTSASRENGSLTNLLHETVQQFVKAGSINKWPVFSNGTIMISKEGVQIIKQYKAKSCDLFRQRGLFPLYSLVN